MFQIVAMIDSAIQGISNSENYSSKLPRNLVS